MRIIKSICAVPLCLALIGCSTITTGTSQPFAVKTAKTTGASCSLVDSKGARWTISSTPGTQEITKGDGPLTVTCSKAGFKTATITVEEGFAGMTAGNILLGGGVGLIVDAASGAAQEYPDEVTVWMEPVSFASAAERSAWFAEKEAYEAAQAKAEEQEKRELNDEKSYN